MPEKSNLRISEDVIAVVANVAASGVDGVADMTGNASGLFGKKNTKGIKVVLTDDSAVIDVHILVELGRKIVDIAEQVQQKVHEEVETMTALSAIVVNVIVVDIQVAAV